MTGELFEITGDTMRVVSLDGHRISIPRLIKESEKKPIIVGVTDNVMELRINSHIGSMKEEIDIHKEGKDILIGFNPKFLMDVLRVVDDEEVTIYMINPKAPCFIKDKEESYIYLILPVNFNAANI